MYKRSGRYHLEWVWDGIRLWIVQCDEELSEPGTPPGSEWQGAASAPPLGRLRIFADIARAPSMFPKVNHVREFAACGLPHADIRVLSGTRVISRLAAGQISRELKRDLRELIRAPVVIRSDFRAATRRPAVLSKRTDTCLSYAELEGFLTSTARAVVRDDAPADLAFIAHRFKLARAGAMSFGRPGSTRVRIDATWGLPDSLLFHPHDSFRVDLSTDSVERRLRCKTDYVDVGADGSWRSRRAGSDWDWRPAITKGEAVQIAAMTAKLADHLGSDIEVMFFIGGTGSSAWVLPWFFDEREHQLTDVQAARGYYVGDRITITSRQDLLAADAELRDSSNPRLFSLSLKPDIDLLREREFILDVAKVANRWGVLVELEGSQLSHAYYLLEDAGVAVRSPNPWHPPDRRRSFGKLVRDLVPVKIERRGELATTYSADRAELRELIKAKMIEEAIEYYWAPDARSTVEELADLLELLHAAARVNGLDFAAVTEAAQTKRTERGGFENGIVLIETRDTASEQGGYRVDQLRSPPPVAAPMRTSRRRASTVRRVLRLPGARLVLPFVPPSGWKIDRSNVVGLTPDTEILITYSATDIKLQVRPRGSDQNEDQLPLFDLTLAPETAPKSVRLARRPTRRRQERR
jgi:predicted house-cleaning noncanonical NTP pyrophosphatase (MazG superfamily)